MRIIKLLPATLVLAMAACNNSSDKTASSADTTATAQAHDSMNMNHAMDTSKMSTDLPAVPAGAKCILRTSRMARR